MCTTGIFDPTSLLGSQWTFSQSRIYAMITVKWVRLCLLAAQSRPLYSNWLVKKSDCYFSKQFFVCLPAKLLNLKLSFWNSVFQKPGVHLSTDAFVQQLRWNLLQKDNILFDAIWQDSVRKQAKVALLSLNDLISFSSIFWKQITVHCLWSK